MRELMNVTFESGKFPADWVETERGCTFERGALRSGRVANVNVPLPGSGWRRLRVEVDVELQPTGGAALTCSDDKLTMAVDLKRHTHGIYFYGGLPLAEGKRAVPAKSGPRRVAFEYHDNRQSISVDGEEFIAGADPHSIPAAGTLKLQFWEDCLVHRVRILGDGEVKTPTFSYPPRRAKDFFLEVNVDFLDDLIYAPYDRGMFDQLFAEFARWGVQRCHWIHYGTHAEGFWDHIIGSDVNYRKTYENVGEIFAAAVQAAHAHGVQIVGMLRPLETGLYYSDGEGTPEFRARSRERRIGGGVSMIPRFCAEHPELTMARKPGVWGPDSENALFHRLDLVKEGDGPADFGVNDLRLYVSDDNVAYRAYEGTMEREELVEDYPVWEHTSSGGRPTEVTRRSRVLRLKNLNLRSKYAALYVEGRGSSFTNTLVNLIHVFGEKGEERRLTYGIMRRSPYLEPDVNGGLIAPVMDFRKVGIEFDTNYGGMGSACYAGDHMSRAHALDSYDGILAFARGKERGPVGRPSPSFPAVREWWLTWVRDCLDAGADGIELRVRNHSYHLAWSEFGFEPPVRDEFLKRHGVDIWQTDDFDKAAWRRLRGEGYTEFYRQAKRLCASYGKPLGLHVSPTNEMDPAIGAAMEIHWDWRTWLKEGLADSVTLKEVWPKTRLAEEILSLTRPRGVPVIFCPYADNAFRTPGGERTIADWIRLARDGGCDGYQFYECAAVIKGTRDGRVLMEQPALRDLFQREFGR